MQRRTIEFLSWAAVTFLRVPMTLAFVPSQRRLLQQQKQQHRFSHSYRLASSSLADNEQQELDLGLTPELKRVTDAFAAIGDEQVRYKQLLYMAQNTKETQSFPDAFKIPENKVPGCLSTVYVHGTAEYSEDAGDYVINFIGDSDGLLTKGLVALLVRCLSGNTAEAIQKVDPQFIKAAKIEQSLTPGRNNGFLNMLKTMKDKAVALDAEARQGGDVSVGVEKANASAAQSNDAGVTGSVDGKGPKYTAIVEALQALKPTKLELIDNSHQHAGHAGNNMDGESHFDLTIVASAFDGLNLVKRHQLIYMMLGEIMPQIHALQIQSLTPEEAKQRGL
ncbi:Fe-S metabolism associated SufE [Nitzschia inconspicua]|uniref:Fe-S metabolism associated SufE n=1 Tax=Nitzschia inconspicua TaxID=303405 RepID=A0A9K3LKQ7_9STRA|nr:Fe-S metabolism associated SufE [Nitzschia inconspicua]